MSKDKLEEKRIKSIDAIIEFLQEQKGNKHFKATLLSMPGDDFACHKTSNASWQDIIFMMESQKLGLIKRADREIFDQCRRDGYSSPESENKEAIKSAFQEFLNGLNSLK